MKIDRFDVFQVNLEGTNGGQHLSGGRVYALLDATILKVTTDAGVIGWGESVPWGSNYLPAFAEGVRAGFRVILPSLIGKDPRQIGQVHQIMDNILYGHPYVKTAIDMACWDLLGKATGLPLYMLLGGKLTEAPYVSGYIGHTTADYREKAIALRRSQGCKHFSVKACGDIESDIAYIKSLGDALRSGESIKMDVNGGWRVDEALRAARAVGDGQLYFEQPCRTYEECRDLRRVSSVPVILDECVDTLNVLIRAKNDYVLDAVSIKAARHGGLWKARPIIDFCISLNIPMYIQDAGASDIGNSMIAHISHSVPERLMIQAWDATNLVGTSTATGGPRIENGRMSASDSPGLGIEPLSEVIGNPIAVYE